MLEDSEDDSDDILLDNTDVNVEIFVDNKCTSAFKSLMLCKVSSVKKQQQNSKLKLLYIFHYI
jgi:hypothetical protein